MKRIPLELLILATFITAFDASTGKELWEYNLPLGGSASPLAYKAKGRQFAVIAATGDGKVCTPLGDAYVASVFPEK